MPFRLTYHARQRRLFWGITHQELAALLEADPVRGDTADEYTRQIGDRLLCLHVVRDSTPPLIITVYEVR